MALCAIVFEVHHTPTATTGAIGHETRTMPWAAASATNTASPAGACPTDRRMASTASVPEVDQGADRRVVGAPVDLGQAGIGGIRIRSRRRVLVGADARLHHVAVPQRDDLSRAGDLLEIRPLAARQTLVAAQREIQIAAHRRRVIVGIVRLGERKDAEYLDRRGRALVR